MFLYSSLGLASHTAKLSTHVKGHQGVNHPPAERRSPSPVTPSPAPATGRGLCEGKQTTDNSLGDRGRGPLEACA